MDLRVVDDRSNGRPTHVEPIQIFRSRLLRMGAIAGNHRPLVQTQCSGKRQHAGTDSSTCQNDDNPRILSGFDRLFGLGSDFLVVGEKRSVEVDGE